MRRTKQLGDLQLAVMRVLWQRGEATVAQVHDALHEERGLAMTTIATVLSRLEKSGLLMHRTAERQFVYRPLVSEGDVRRSMVGNLIDQLFHGDSTALVSHLLKESDISPGDLAEVKSLIEAKEAEESGGINGQPGTTAGGPYKEG
jgi:predicted transcriptional regulator